MVTETKNIRLSHETLRRLAQRALEVIERHGASDPMLTALGTTLGPAATAYLDAFDAVHASTSRRRLAAVRAVASVQQLNERCLGWAQVIARDAPRFDPVEYSVRSEVPHDVIANARKLVAFVSGYPTEEPALSYAQQILSELSQLIPVAQQDANAAKATLVTQQELQKTSREAAAEFYRQALLFRRVLRRLLGSSHRDCRLLHVERASTATPDAEEQMVVVDTPDATDEAGDAEPRGTGTPTVGSNTTPAHNGSPSLLNAPRA